MHKKLWPRSENKVFQYNIHACFHSARQNTGYNHCILILTAIQMITDGVGTLSDTVAQNYSQHFQQLFAFSALTLLIGRQEGHPACKKLSGGVLAWLSVWGKVQTCIWPS